MSIKAALHSHLTGRARVTDALRVNNVAPADGGVYWGAAPQRDVKRYIVIHRISANHDRHLRASSGLVEDLFQFDCVAEDSAAAEAISEAVREVLDTFRGEMGDENGAYVNGAYLDDESDQPMIPSGAESVGRFTNRMDFRIWHAETVPSP